MLVGAHLRGLSIVALVIVGGTIAAGRTVEAAGFDCDSGSGSYTVQAGDGWFAIADRAAVSVRDVLGANGASLDDMIHPGDRLCLPAGADRSGLCASAYTVGAGDSWYLIADRAGVRPADLLAVNGAGLADSLFPGDGLCLPAGASIGSDGSASAGPSYEIRSGDSWYGIAQRASVSVRSLLTVNGASPDSLIVPGQTIALPAGAREPAAAPELDALPTQGPCWYSDTWGAPRSGGRRHRGVDIFTRRGDYVYAVADGRLSGRIWDGSGQVSGNAWMLTADDGTRYFYAHLADFAPELSVGSKVRAGQIIGWVGSTGNASAAHLHFEIRPGGGEPIDPYPTVKAAGGCNQDAPYVQPGGWRPDSID